MFVVGMWPDTVSVLCDLSCLSSHRALTMTSHTPTTNMTVGVWPVNGGTAWDLSCLRCI